MGPAPIQSLPIQTLPIQELAHSNLAGVGWGGWGGDVFNITGGTAIKNLITKKNNNNGIQN